MELYFSVFLVSPVLILVSALALGCAGLPFMPSLSRRCVVSVPARFSLLWFDSLARGSPNNDGPIKMVTAGLCQQRHVKSHDDMKKDADGTNALCAFVLIWWCVTLVCGNIKKCNVEFVHRREELEEILILGDETVVGFVLIEEETKSSVCVCVCVCVCVWC